MKLLNGRNGFRSISIIVFMFNLSGSWPEVITAINKILRAESWRRERGIKNGGVKKSQIQYS